MPENTELLIKLFDTLKHATDKNEETIQKLILQQEKLVGHIEYLPIADLQNALKEHDKSSSENVDSCTETVQTKSDTILDKVKSVETKISKMILVVIVAFSLFTTALFIASYINKKDELKYTDLQDVIDFQGKKLNEQHEKLDSQDFKIKELEEIIESLKK